jgi:enolase
MSVIKQLSGREVLDSRGRPTVWAHCVLSSGFSASVSVPSGVSTGSGEALELRDGDPLRYRGLGCKRAVANITGPIKKALIGQSIADQAQLDQLLISLDGTPNKSALGANAILAVSLAFARAQAEEEGIPLYRHFGRILGITPHSLPRLTINLFSGGKHAGQQIPIQDVLIVPLQSASIDDSLATAYDVYQCAAELVLKRYGMRLLTADEGGLAPPCSTVDEMLALAVEAIELSGRAPGSQVALAMDVAASHFFEDGKYRLGSETLESGAMIDRLTSWVTKYPIVSVEDGLAETDWEHWPLLTRALGKSTLVIGDDLLCTNSKQIVRAIDSGACNALLLKVNQIGTLTEAAEAYTLARAAGWSVTVSVRSGETEDNWAADLAVGWDGDQFKNGSITQSERLAKYNRLLAIEEDTEWPIKPWPTRASRYE